MFCSTFSGIFLAKLVERRVGPAFVWTSAVPGSTIPLTCAKKIYGSSLERTGNGFELYGGLSGHMELENSTLNRYQ